MKHLSMQTYSADFLKELNHLCLTSQIKFLEGWANISINTLLTLVESLIRRVEDVAAKGHSKPFGIKNARQKTLTVPLVSHQLGCAMPTRLYCHPWLH